jgi:hypothetical protein
LAASVRTSRQAVPIIGSVATILSFVVLSIPTVVLCKLVQLLG